MKKIPFILMMLFFAALTASEVRDFFVKDDGVAYFRNDARRFFYVLAIGLAGGLGFGLFALLSKKMQARIKYLLAGFTAVASVCFTVFFLGEMTRLDIWSSQNIRTAEIVLIFEGAFLVNAVLLLESWLLRKKSLTI
jgi:hypothetical protein